MQLDSRVDEVVVQVFLLCFPFEVTPEMLSSGYCRQQTNRVFRFSFPLWA